MPARHRQRKQPAAVDRRFDFRNDFFVVVAPLAVKRFSAVVTQPCCHVLFESVALCLRFWDRVRVSNDAGDLARLFNKFCLLDRSTNAVFFFFGEWLFHFFIPFTFLRNCEKLLA